MTPGEFEGQVHQECLRILRFLASRRYDSAGQCAAALALLAEEQSEQRRHPYSLFAEDPYDLKLLNAFDLDEEERDS